MPPRPARKRGETQRPAQTGRSARGRPVPGCEAAADAPGEVLPRRVGPRTYAPPPSKPVRRPRRSTTTWFCGGSEQGLGLPIGVGACWHIPPSRSGQLCVLHGRSRLVVLPTRAPRLRWSRLFHGSACMICACDGCTQHHLAGLGLPPALTSSWSGPPAAFGPAPAAGAGGAWVPAGDWRPGPRRRLHRACVAEGRGRPASPAGPAYPPCDPTGRPLPLGRFGGRHGPPAKPGPSSHLAHARSGEPRGWAGGEARPRPLAACYAAARGEVRGTSAE
jgi:hypothetical protein